VAVRFEVSQVPKSEAPGAPSIEVNAVNQFHALRVGNAGRGLKPNQWEEDMDARTMLDHHFTVAAYAITWAIQLGYLVRLGLKWWAQKRSAERFRILPFSNGNHF